MRPDTSSSGRFQFSDENANTVRCSTPRLAQALMVLTSASTPCLWPKMRGMKRFFAQRPLPSMTMATWRGTSGLRAGAWAADTGGFTKRIGLLDSQDLGFFGVHQLVDLGDGAVGQLLDVVDQATLLVLGDVLVLEQL